MGIIKKQGIQNTIITYFGILIGFLNLIVVQPNLLSKEEIGLLRLLLGFSSLVASIIPLGITNITVRYFPVFRNHEKGHYGFLGFILLFPIAGGMVTYLLVAIFKSDLIRIFSVNSKLFADYFDYVLPFSIILGFITVLNTYCFSLFKTIVPSILTDIANRLLTILIVFFYFKGLYDIHWLVIMFVLIYAVQLAMLLIYLKKIDTPKLKVDRPFLKEQNLSTMLQYGFMLSFAGIASIALKYIDSIMIGVYMPIGFVGIYGIVVFIPQIIEAPLNSLDRIAYTKLAHALSTNNHRDIEEIYYKSSKYLFMIGGALFLLINANIKDLLSFLPDDYSAGINVVLIISVGTLLNMAGGSNTSLIFNSKHYKAGGLLLVSMAAMTLALNILLIPRYGLEGSAFATAITVSFYAVMRFLIIYRGYKLQPYDRNMLKILFLVVLGFASIYFIPQTSSAILNILYRSAFIMGIYLAGIYYLRVAPELHGLVPFLRKGGK